MNQVISTFCLSLLHSLWQGALLVAIYRGLNSTLLKKSQPLEKRNLLYMLLVAQFATFASTFMLLMWSRQTSGNVFEVEPGSFVHWPSLLNNVVFGIYVIAVLYKFIQVCNRWKNFRILTADRIAAPVELRLFVSVKAREIGIGKKISIWLSEHLATPLTYGWMKPVILMPAALVNQLTIEEVEALILHELAHISSKDYALNFVVIASEILFFFNPFTKLICREIKVEREKSCDQKVIQFKYSPLLYAGTLLKTARFYHEAPQFALAAVSEKSTLMERIKLITGDTDHQPRKAANPGLYAFLILMFMAIGLFGVSSLKQKQPASLAQTSESYAPNEVFSFVKEASMDERRHTILHTETVGENNNKGKLCDVSKEKPCKPRKTQPNRPAESFVKAETGSRLQEKYFTIPIASKELIEKEVEITEDDPESGTTITTGLKMTWTESGWVAKPMWQTKLKRDEAVDSSRVDSLTRPVPFYEVQ